MELWGGCECTVNRVGDVYFDQIRRSGHQDRLSDLSLIADLGVNALRYPVLWERVAAAGDFNWEDARLAEIRRLGMRPIVGLIHHGSGPAGVDLLSSDFAAGLADHARRAAERYDWVSEWTPVNEPLTTARFSALYGWWYPHARDEGACWRALLNQIDATRLSMKAIRAVRSDAQLVQTEDLGYTHATPYLAAQARYENARRWLTWDLLFGRVTANHPLWSRLARHGLADRLKAIADDPCPPDVIGVNHYLTSERFIDERLELYPAHTHGGNGALAYADVEAVRTGEPRGLKALLAETHRRYGADVAVTECHLGCTREEQMRWFAEAWRDCRALNAEGVPVRAVTAWSMFGAYDWNALLRTNAGHYESGVFDLSGGAPRPTALARLLQRVSGRKPIDEPSLAQPGWWKRDVRRLYPARPERTPPQGRPILILGRSGTLGQAFARAATLRGLPHALTGRETLCLTDAASIDAALENLAPWAVINAAGFVRVDAAETDRDACLEANAYGVHLLAQACAARGLPLLTFSSDLVFDGKVGRPYVETDAPAPLNVYGAAKAEAERLALAAHDRTLVVRTAAFFSPHDAHNFARTVTEALSRGEPFAAANDLFVSPTYVPDLTRAALDLLIDGETGIWHLANRGRVTWADFARIVAEAMRLDSSLIRPVSHQAFNWAAPRPADVALTSTRGALMPSLFDAVERFARARARRPATGAAISPA